MKIIGYMLIFLVGFLLFYGFLILKEYARYYRRKLQLKLDKKLRKEK